MSREPVIPQHVHQPVIGFVELGEEHDPIVHIQDPYDPAKSVAVRRSALQSTPPTPARDLTPQPLLDPLAQRMLAGGVGAGVAAWGAGEFLAGASRLVSALAGIGSAAAVIALLLLAWKMTPSNRTGKTVNVTNINRWGGRSSTHM
ncbi:hypothetical protein [Streptomyces zaomyceticus]|uniref:hypothetical protein n=1 Tax=Streptomyces zaomyceticus TaxID=68286 RepID=UPI002E1A90AA